LNNGPANTCSSIKNTGTELDSYFCTLLCDGEDAGTCGENAFCRCVEQVGLCVCVPDRCRRTGLDS
jgi:hypothetical protein